MKDEDILKGQGEYKKCMRCEKRFRRKKSIWNTFLDDFILCPKCNESFNKWLKENEE